MKDKPLNEKAIFKEGYDMGYTHCETEYQERVKKLKENKYLFNTKYWITISEEEIDKIMGNFNHRHSEGTVNGTVKEDTHVKKYTKKYSKRNGIHQVGLKEDKQ